MSDDYGIARLKRAMTAEDGTSPIQLRSLVPDTSKRTRGALGEKARNGRLQLGEARAGAGRGHERLGIGSGMPGDGSHRRRDQGGMVGVLDLVGLGEHQLIVHRRLV